ncbi:tyrosine-type recombinase/integrase [soil metagenome]
MPRIKYSIREHRGRFQARWRDTDGRQRVKTFARKSDAVAHLDATRSDIRRGTWVDPDLGRERFSEFAERWAEAQDWKPTTRDSFGPHLRRISKRLGKLELGAIDRLVLESTRRGLLDAGYARSTATISMHYASTIMRSAYQSGLVTRYPTVGLKPPRRRVGDPDGRVSPDDVPTRNEVLRILAATPSRYRAAVALGIAGLRISEVLAVTADRLDLDTRTLLVDRQLQRIDGTLQFTGPKREKVRTIELPMVTLLEMRRHLRDHQGAGLLFRTPRSGEMMRRDQLYDTTWRPALVGAGMTEDRFVFHSLRHFCVSSMLAGGAPLTAVAGHLGDTVETVSKVYLHWLRDDRSVPRIVLDRLLTEHDEIVPIAETP